MAEPTAEERNSFRMTAATERWVSVKSHGGAPLVGASGAGRRALAQTVDDVKLVPSSRCAP